MRDEERVTLVVRRPGAPARFWDESARGGKGILFVDSMSFASQAVQHAVDEHRDIARVVVDRAGTPVQFHQLLTSLPQQFVGDVLFIQDGGESFLSALGRGGDRVLYSLLDTDVAFYLNTFKLAAEALTIELERLAQG